MVNSGQRGGDWMLFDLPPNFVRVHVEPRGIRQGILNVSFEAYRRHKVSFLNRSG